MVIAEILLTLAEHEIASGLHKVSHYINELAAKLDKHPIKLIGEQRGIRVPAIELKKKAEPYHIAELDIQGDTKTVDMAKKRASIGHQSALTACIKSRKREMPGQRRGDFSIHDIELDTKALALMICYLAPHCRTFDNDFKDFQLILKNLSGPGLNNETALAQAREVALKAREFLDQSDYKFAFESPMDLFLTEKGDNLDQERALINQVFQDAYTLAKKLYDEAGAFTIGKRAKADKILNHLRELSHTLKSIPSEIQVGMHKRLATALGDRDEHLYGILNTSRVFPCKETKSARLFRQRHMTTDSSSAETAFENPPPYKR